MGLLERLLHPRCARERRHPERQRVALRRELGEYALLLDTIERRPAVTADTSLTVERSGAASPAPRLAAAIRNELAPEFARLAAAHPDDASIAGVDARWRERLSQLEHRARPRDRRPRAALQFDRQDHLHRGWWHGP